MNTSTKRRHNSYTAEFKNDIVRRFLKSNLSYRTFASNNNLKYGTLSGWVSSYKTDGEFVDDCNENNNEDHKRNYDKYSSETKLKLIEEYKKSNLSVLEFTRINNIKRTTFLDWLDKYESFNNQSLFIDVTDNLISVNNNDNNKETNSFLPRLIESNNELIKLNYKGAVIEVNASNLSTVLKAIKDVEI